MCDSDSDEARSLVIALECELPSALNSGFVARGHPFAAPKAFFNRVPLNVFKLLAGAGVPVSRQASVVSLLGTRPLGMRVGYGLILVDMTKACGFFFVLLLLMLDKIMFVLSIVTQFAPDS